MENGETIEAQTARAILSKPRAQSGAGQTAQENTLITFHESDDAVMFAVKIHPRAKKNAIAGAVGDALKLSLTAPPVDGRANEACIEFLAKLLNLPRSSVSIASGRTGGRKLIRIIGMSAEEVRKHIKV